MRRTLFYLSVALLAFGSGSLVVFKFYGRELLEVATKQTQIEIKPIEQNIVDEISAMKFSCEDEVLKTVWKRLEKNKTFIDDAYTNVIEPRQIKDCRELFADAKPISLNDNNSDEFIVIGNQYLFCNSGGNCQAWIVSKKNNRFKIVFESTAGNSTTKPYLHDDIQSLRAKTHKFKDLKVFIPNGWDADNIGYFKFVGNKYQIRKCLRDFNSAYVYDNDYVEKWLVVKSNECLKGNLF